MFLNDGPLPGTATIATSTHITRVTLSGRLVNGARGPLRDATDLQLDLTDIEHFTQPQGLTMDYRSRFFSRCVLSAGCVVLLTVACAGEDHGSQALLGISGDADPNASVAAPDTEDLSDDSVQESPVEDHGSQALLDISGDADPDPSVAAPDTEDLSDDSVQENPVEEDHGPQASSTTTSTSTTTTSPSPTTPITTGPTTQITPPVTGGGAGSVVFYVQTAAGQGISASATLHGHTFSMPDGRLVISDMTCGATVTVAINDPNFEFESGGMSKTYEGCPPGVIRVKPTA